MTTKDEQTTNNFKRLIESVQYQIYTQNVDPPADQESKDQAQAEMELAFIHFMPNSDIGKMIRGKLEWQYEVDTAHPPITI